MSQTTEEESLPSREIIRVLIAGDRPDTQENFRRMLLLRHSIAIIGAAATGEEAVKQTATLRPDVVLMDLKIPGMDGITATEIITKQCPYAYIIMMSIHSDGESVRNCMLAGARDFLVKPCSADDLAASIRRVYERESNRFASFKSMAPLVQAPEPVAAAETQRGKLITVFSPKGGAGSSTIAVNLAVSLQKTGDRKVALVDANLQFGDVAALLDLKPELSASDLVPQIGDLDTHLMEAVLASHSSGLKALLAPDDLESSDLVTPEYMEVILGRLQDMFDYVIVDTKGFLYDLVLKLLELADRVLLIGTPDIPTLKSVRQFLSFVQTQSGSTERYLLIINKANRVGSIEVSDIEDGLKKKVTRLLPDDRLAVAQASGVGIPCVLSSPKSPLSQSIIGLSMWLIDDLEKQGHDGGTSGASPSKRRWPLSRKKRQKPN